MIIYMSRRSVPDSTQSEILVQSRRRCCVCFGIKRDESIQRGQIAHLDGDSSNNGADNLAFLCLAHHDEYDGKTSQSKGLTSNEVKKYRTELYAHFGDWLNQNSRNHLLNFLACTIDADAMADAAIKAAGKTVWYAESLALEVLTTDNFNSCDGDLYMPYLAVLDYFALWGWLSFTAEEKEQDGERRVFIQMKRQPICNDIAKIIQERIKSKEKSKNGT